nr:unnamed protein product [Digitaria exilis]
MASSSHPCRLFPGESAGSPSFGTKPGSRRRGYKGQVTSASGTEGAHTNDGKDDGEPVVAIAESGDDASDEPKDSVDEYVIYETPEEEELSELEEERRRLEEIGPIAYYSEWVEAYKNKDTSREAIQKHFEETGEDENAQLIKMFQHQTAGEYRVMMGTDDPEEVIDYRGPEFHEPTPEVVPYLMEHGTMITKEELYARLNEERDDVNQDITYIPEVKDPMATAVDIGEHSYNEDSDDEDEDVDKAAVQPESLEDEDGEEKVTQNWSVLKSTGQAEKPKEKSKKGEMSIKEAIDDSENLTDFLMDFEEDE